MKKLYLARHAKSDWGHEGLNDIDRPLNQRGYDDAYRMAALFKKKNLLPELIVTSPATRAISTSFIFAREFGIEEQTVSIFRDLYEASFNSLQSRVQKFNDKYNCIMLFGHNPGLTRFFNEVSDAEVDNIPTCGIVQIDFEASSWKNVFEKTGKCVLSEFPKDFKS